MLTTLLWLFLVQGADGHPGLPGDIGRVGPRGLPGPSGLTGVNGRDGRQVGPQNNCMQLITAYSRINTCIYIVGMLHIDVDVW